MGTVLHCTNFITTKTSNFEVLISEMSLCDPYTLHYAENLRRNDRELTNIQRHLGITATSTRSLPFHHPTISSMCYLSVKYIILRPWH